MDLIDWLSIMSLFSPGDPSLDKYGERLIKRYEKKLAKHQRKVGLLT
jgi:hypothetical protein